MGATSSSDLETFDLGDARLAEKLDFVVKTQSGKPVNIERLGKHLFKGEISKPYLIKHGLPEDTLDSHTWTTNGNADKVINLQPVINYYYSYHSLSDCLLLGRCCNFGLGQG